MNDVIVKDTQIGSFVLRSFGAVILEAYFTDPEFKKAINETVNDCKVQTMPEGFFADLAYFSFSHRLQNFAIEWLKTIYGSERITEMDYTLEGEEE